MSPVTRMKLDYVEFTRPAILVKALLHCDADPCVCTSAGRLSFS